jgi:cell wall-associated NlpC family hydrolase
MLRKWVIENSHASLVRALGAGLAWTTLLTPLAAAGPASARDPTSPSATAPTTVWHGAQDLAIYALGLIGVDYRFGGTTPERGLDCSGLVRYVFQQVTGVTLPRTSQELSRLGEKVAVTELLPGDLVFFNTRQLQFSHVGIYIGEDRFIHAPRRGGEVEVVTLSRDYWRKRFDGARRLVGALPDLIPSAEAGTTQVDARPEPKPAGDGSAATNRLSPEEFLHP